MPLVSEAADFSYLEGLDVPDLYARFQELKASLTYLPDGCPDPNAVQDDIKLNEICVILSQLRKKSAGPPKKRPVGPRAKAPVVETSLDDL